MIIQGSPEILHGPRGLNNQFGAFDAADDAVKELYLAVLGREADPGGLQYFTDRFGTSIEPGEAIIFQNMAQAEIQARNAYLAQQMALSAEAAANARAIAAEFERKQNEGKTYFYEPDTGMPIRLISWYNADPLDTAAAAVAAAAAAAAEAAAEAATKKAIADAYAAAQAASKAAEEADARAKADAASMAQQRADEQAFFRRKKAVDLVKAIYLQVLGREGDAAGLNYFADRFGDVIDPDELQIFSDMSKPEIDARNAYLADMAAKSAKDAAEAKAIAEQFAKASADELARQNRIIGPEIFAPDPNVKAAAAAAAAAAAQQAAAAAAEAAYKKAVADAYAAAQAASKAAVEASNLAAKEAADALRARALLAVKALYLQVLGREGDQAGLDYFADRFGDVIDPDELQIFSDMSKPEIDARNAYLADMAKKSKEDAAKAKAIADQFAATAAKAKADAAAAAAKAKADAEEQIVKIDSREIDNFRGSGGISPMLILAAAAAAFFIGG